LKRAAQAQRQIQCQESFELVDALALVRDIFPAALKPDWMRDDPKEVFVSYRHNPQSKAIVDRFQTSLEQRGIHILRDRDRIHYKDSISAFMKDIGRGTCIIVVISKEYFESPYCMFELTEIAERGELLDRVFPITLDDANIHDGVFRAHYAAYWEKRKKELDAAIAQTSGENLPKIREEVDLCAKIRAHIDRTLGMLSDLNALTPAEHQGTTFEELYRKLESRLNG
jgi:internalin A